MFYSDYISLNYYLQNTNEDLDSPDDLTLHVDNIMKIVGAEGGCLWMQLQKRLSVSKEQADILERRHSAAALQDLLQLWLEKPEASWKLLIDALNKEPEPGPELAKIIVTKHTNLVKEEEDERAVLGVQPLTTAENEVLDLQTFTRDQTNVAAVIESVNSVHTKLHEKMHEVRNRLETSNEQFLTEVKEGASYWKSKHGEEHVLNLSIANKLEDIIAIVKELQGSFQKVTKHYTNVVFLERKLHSELIEAKKYMNEPYFKQLQVRIARLKHLRSKKQALLQPTYEALQTLSSIILTAEENHTKCSELTMDDRQYMLQLKAEFNAANGALDRMRTNLAEYLDLKKKELRKWHVVQAFAIGAGVAGVALAPFTFGITLFFTAGANIAFIGTQIYTNEVRSAVRDYEGKVDQCSSYSQNIRADLVKMEQDFKITENKNLAILRRFIV